jgi:co-chaperonin GroES (HSP10)
MNNESGLSPVEFNCVVKLDPTEQTTPGGIILPSSKTERDELAMDEGTLVAVSPHAFTYAEWPEGSRKPQPGDRVLFSRYSGALLERNGAKFRVLKDSAIIAIVDRQPALAAVA